MPDYEVLIQDGCSTDDTIELIRQFQQSNFQMSIFLRQEKDTGVYDAMNKAMRQARGEWLYFLGSNDELYDSNVLNSMLGCSHAETHRLLYGNVMVVPEGFPAQDCYVSGGPSDLRALLRTNICHQAIFYRNVLIKEVGEYNTRYRISGDWDFNIRCWSKVPFKFVNVIVARFYLGGLSSSGQRDLSFEEELPVRLMEFLNLKLYGKFLNNTDFYSVRHVMKMQQAKGFFYANLCAALRFLRRHADRARGILSRVRRGLTRYLWAGIRRQVDRVT